VPTPVGGQSVGQICARLGEGPTLQKINGKFNHTVYADAQCGNGPFPDERSAGNKQCAGHLGVSGEDCKARGPRWDLSTAYSKAMAEPAQTVTTKIDTEQDTEGSIVTGGSRYIKPPVKQASSKKKKEQPAINTSVAEIARTRSNSKKIAKRAPKPAVPETREQLRARQLVHLAAARKRANLTKPSEPKTAEESVEGLLPKEPAAAVNSAKIEPAKTDSSKKASVESVANTTTSPSVTKDTPTTVAALKVPVEIGNSNPDFNYIEAAPVTYDFGGAGLSVAASKSSHARGQYVLQAAVADTYREAAIGIGVFYSPPKAQRVTLMARTGFEYGQFNFKNDSVEADHSDTGLFARFATRFAVTRRFQLQAGISYSSFFEGDAVGFGHAFYQLTPKLDLTAQGEAGDNDLFGFGIRYHY